MTSQNLKCEKYTSCTTGDHFKYYTIFALIGVPAKKILGGNEVLPKSCDVCPNHDFLVLYG